MSIDVWHSDDLISARRRLRVRKRYVTSHCKIFYLVSVSNLMSNVSNCHHDQRLNYPSPPSTSPYTVVAPHTRQGGRNYRIQPFPLPNFPQLYFQSSSAEEYLNSYNTVSYTNQCIFRPSLKRQCSMLLTTK